MFSKRSIVATMALVFVLSIIGMLHWHATAFQQQTADGRTVSGAAAAAGSTLQTKQTDLSDPSFTFAIVFDCGSSGTRVYLYYWPPHSGQPSDLLDIRPVLDANGKPISKKVSPGLSTYASKPSEAAEYLFPLLDMAASILPKEKHKQTPLYVLATAGMRLIPTEQAEQIIADIVVDIPLKYDFVFSKSQVEIISGKQEGVYAWISLNYLLGRFHHVQDDSNSADLYAARDAANSSVFHARKQTVGVIDMGGGSVQIAFEVPPEVDVSHHDDLVADLNLGCRETDREHRYRLYVTTHLGFGANVATQRYRDGLVADAEAATLRAAAAQSISPTQLQPVVRTEATTHVADDPCLPLDLVDEHDVKMATADSSGGAGDSSTVVTWQLRGTGDFEQCRQRLRPLLNRTLQCEKQISCSVNGVFQPEIPRFWSFYGISEYWYSLHDVFDIAGSYNSRTAVEAAKTFCRTPWAETLQRHSGGSYPFADMARLKSECFKVGWIMTMLHEGFRFPESDTKFMSINEINGQEVQWTLGSLIFKTRYFPASSIQHSHEVLSIWAVQSRLLLPYAAALCFLVVLAAIALFSRHLRAVPAAMQTVKSSSDYLLVSTGEDYDVEGGISSSYRRA